MEEKMPDPRARQIKRAPPAMPESLRAPPVEEQGLDPRIMEDMLQEEKQRAQQRENPLLARARIPGQTFALPSGGVFYTHGEIDGTVTNGEVIVYPMVTLDELIMKTPDKLLNGTALVEVFSRCIPQVLKPLELLAKDVDFLMVCLRKVTYGDEFQIDYQHDCENAKEHSYVIPLDALIRKAKKLNTKKAEKDYTLVLPNEQVVQLIPPKYFQMLKFYQTISNEETTNEEMSIQIITSAIGMVEKVDGISDRNMIEEWLHTVPAGFINQISSKVAELGEWGVLLSHDVKCRDCNETVSLEITLNPISFFS